MAGEALVEQLRSLGACAPGCNGRCAICPDEVARQAADEIERLRAELNGAAHNRFYDQRDGYFEGVEDGKRR